MFTLLDNHRIFIAIQPIDFRTRLEGSLAICRQRLQQDPMSGHLFLFRNKSATTLRIILYENQGFWLLEKRLSKGRFQYWPTSSFVCAEMTRTQLQQVLENL
jgi:transposase